MGLKKFTNSPAGRKAIALSSLILTSVLFSGALCAWAYYYPSSLENSLEGKLNMVATNLNVSELALGAEENPLPELPSTTLTYKVSDSDANDKSDIFTHPVGLAYQALSKESLDSLMNVSTSYAKAEAGETRVEYAFKFYSGSLSDYSLGSAYEDALHQFFVPYGLDVGRIELVSKPSSSGGRELTLDVKANYNFTKANSDKASKLWQELVTGLTDAAILEPGTLIKLSLSDPQAVSINTILTSQDDAVKATSFYPVLWTTFAAYAYETEFSFLKATKVEYTVERTPEDSTLIVTVDETLRGTDIRGQILGSSNEVATIAVIWSYNTYYITPTNATPFLAFDSSSKNW